MNSMLPKAGEGHTDLKRVMSIWEDLKTSGIRPDLNCYNTLLRLCRDSKPNEQPMAFEIYREMLASDIFPDCRTFDILLMVCWKLKRFDTAREVWDEIKDHVQDRKLKLDSQLCNSLLHVGARSDRGTNTEEIAKFIDELRQIMQTQKIEADKIHFDRLIVAYGKANQLDKAQNIFNTMVKKGMKADLYTYTALLSACDETNNPQAAYDVFHKMVSQKPDTTSTPHPLKPHQQPLPTHRLSKYQQQQQQQQPQQQQTVQPDTLFLQKLRGVLDRNRSTALKQKVAHYYASQQQPQQQQQHHMPPPTTTATITTTIATPQH
eukprot:TRINITY_DN7347_c1_g1_i1.p1 TRINITY_DN7347_c1_g1~~TRINITY_DN7347_c1_g1_i1.p1  ORF type:complete len:320 (+),score=105.95 TRINITY_DN7347_c1_g1_i1:336-1295(+)